MHIVFNLFISDFIALTSKHYMLEKVPKIKDFYIICRCSNTQVSIWLERRRKCLYFSK